MENEQLITPWDVEEAERQDTFYVPEYVVNMAYEVIKHYDMKVSHMEVITTKADKGGLIWKIDTDKGPRSLKLLHRRPTRSLFSLGAQEYLVKEKKARVPQIIPTKDDKLYVEMGGKLWFVAEWIESLFQVTKDLEGAKELCYAIGEFHKLSKGYTPPPGAENASRLYRWPKTYNKIVKKMTWLRDIATVYDEMPASATVLSVIDMFEEQAVKALERLENSAYYDLVKKGNKEWGLVHQDYGWSNGQKGEGGMWIIDLDGVAYDLPIRDLQKLMTGTMDDLGGWDIHWIKEMISAYHEANPIDDQLYEILMIDLSLPNLFYKNVKEMVYEPTIFMDEELKNLVQRIVDIDKTKWSVLDQLADNSWLGGKSK